MTLRLLHFTDIHFGVEHVAAVEATVAYAAEAKPDLVVVSGDITQKGYPREFRAAADWLARLPKPQITCPGNHDVPYHDLLGRIVYPWARFDKFVGPHWRHGLRLPGLEVQAMSSARGLQLRMNWSKGVMDLGDVDVAIRKLQAAAPDALRVFVVHHPLVEVTGGPMTGEVKRGKDAAVRLCEGGVDLIMTGHIHAPFAYRLPYGDGCTVATGASTLSLRERGAAAGFNQLEIDADMITVKAMAWREDRFVPDRTWTLPRRVRTPHPATRAA